MKKFIVLVMAVALFASCGNRSTKTSETECCATDSVEVVVDSIAVAADTVLVVE